MRPCFITLDKDSEGREIKPATQAYLTSRPSGFALEIHWGDRDYFVEVWDNIQAAVSYLGKEYGFTYFHIDGTTLHYITEKDLANYPRACKLKTDF